MIRIGAALLAALVLGGCWWSGPVFYQPDPASPGPFEPGLYRGQVEGEKTRVFQLVRLPNGAFKSSDETGKDQAETLFARLRFPGRSLWIVQMSEPKETEAGYGLLEQRGSHYHLGLLPCEGSEDLVRAAGGIVEGTKDSLGGVGCKFSSRDSLERALVAYASAHAKIGALVEMQRIGD